MTLSLERALEALEAGKASNDARTTARALDTLATLQQFSDPVGAQPLFDEASALAASVGDRWCQTDAVQKAAYSDFYRDRWDDALARAEESAALARELENPFFLSWHETLVGMAAVRTGAHELGRAALRRAIDLAAEVGEPMTIASPASVMVLADLALGSQEEAEATTDELVALLGERANDGFAALEIAYMRSACTLANGDPETAAALLGPVIDELLAENVRFPTAIWIIHLGYAELAMGDATAAGRTLTRAREIAQAIGNSALESGADGLEALIHRVAGRPDKADPLFRRAIAGFRETGLRPDAVDSLELFAGTAAELGNAKTAALLLASVDAARAEHGWTAWVLRPFADVLARDRALVAEAHEEVGDGPPLGLDAAFELVLRGRGARGRPTTGWGSLTPTEREVVRFVAAGKSNPEIAEALFISRSTVKTHVSHVLAKLGLASRAELAGAAVREGEASPEG